MAANVFANRLAQYATDPGSFTGSPGYQFALNQGLQASQRRAAASGLRGSGNALAEAAKYATGLASQDYGNEFDRMTRASQVQGDQNLGADRLALDTNLGEGNLDLGRQRLASDTALGQGQQALTRDLGFGRLNLDRDLGQGAQATTRRGQDLDYSLGSTRANNDFTLGNRNADINSQRNQFDYNLGTDRNSTDFYNAQTQRGTARSQDWLRRQSQLPPRTQTYNLPGSQVTRWYGGG